MIQIPQSTIDYQTLLASDFIADKTPLKNAAGFAAQSAFAGQARQTFTLALSETSIARIRQQVEGIYDQLIADCWPAGEVLPFDMVRFDAFLLPQTDELKIIEMNTRNVGLHEVVEWLDILVAETLKTPVTGSLNQRFVENQKTIHASMFGPDEPLLYVSPAYLPRWTYLAELQKAYSKVTHITNRDQEQITDEGIVVDGYTFKAITRKMAWPVTDQLKQLDLDKTVRLLQTRWMRPFGHKDYLQRLVSPAILKTETYTDEHHARYVENQANLVLKIVNGGNSNAVYLGGLESTDSWAKKLVTAAEQPEKWIVQEYCQPPRYPVIAHGIGEQTVPTQLGIFVLPCPEDPTRFDMDITVKAYAGTAQHFTFDPSGLNPDIWFGHVLKLTV